MKAPVVVAGAHVPAPIKMISILAAIADHDRQDAGHSNALMPVSPRKPSGDSREVRMDNAEKAQSPRLGPARDRAEDFRAHAPMIGHLLYSAALREDNRRNLRHSRPHAQPESSGFVSTASSSPDARERRSPCGAWEFPSADIRERFCHFASAPGVICSIRWKVASCLCGPSSCSSVWDVLVSRLPSNSRK
jgi:hypothetical protein